MNRSQLVEIAQKVYNDRDTPGDKQDKRTAQVVVAALRGTGPTERDHPKKGNVRKGQDDRPGSQLGKNQCAYCKKEGHWMQECPIGQIGKTREKSGLEERGS